LVFFVILFTLLAEALFVFRPMVEKIRRLGKQADRDHLTGLLNRRSFELLAEKTFSMAVRNKQVFSLITFDIDRFKIINDTYGHDVGDKAIQHISKLIISGSRDSDIVSRFGGEEFVVMLPTTNRENASVVAEKIRKKIQNSPFTLNELVIEMTVSGGVSQYLRTEKGWFASLKRSDKALYQAKNSGRNRTCVV
jgi:diguanylate cyclase (GGDEF)-like protein